jgi:hypothetical protein
VLLIGAVVITIRRRNHARRRNPVFEMDVAQLSKLHDLRDIQACRAKILRQAEHFVASSRGRTDNPNEDCTDMPNFATGTAVDDL